MINVASPAFIGKEREYVLDCIDRVSISSGKYVHWFEDSFAEFSGTEYAVAICNGTAALHVALLGLGVQPGDRVLMPVLTYIATANAVRYCDAEPVFCDVDRHTWCLDPVEVERQLKLAIYEGKRISGILPVHLYGVPCDMDALMNLAGAYDCWVLEDAAEAHGARYRGMRTGTMGDVGVFSFYANKIITTGEGGMVVTDDENVATKVRLLRGQGVDPNRRYYHSVVGYNYRMTDLQAAIGLAQLEKFGDHSRARKELGKMYRKRLLGKVEMQAVTLDSCSAEWMTSIVVSSVVEKCRIVDELTKREIETRPIFYPVNQMPPYRSSESFPVSERLSKLGLNLPSHAGVTEAQVEEICGVICGSH